MYSLIVGVGQVSIHMRHARGLKEKRNVLKSLKQRLKNRGFSVSETGFHDDPKTGSLGFSYCGNDHAQVEAQLDEALGLFFGDYELTSKDKDVFDYSYSEGELEFNEEKYGGLEEAE